MKRHLILVPVLLGFFATLYVNILSWSQEKHEYPSQVMTLSINREKVDQDSVLVLFSTRGLLGLLKEYQAYSDTVTIEVNEIGGIYYDLFKQKMVRDTVKVKQKGTFMSLEGFMDWLENVKLKGSN